MNDKKDKKKRCEDCGCTLNSYNRGKYCALHERKAQQQQYLLEGLKDEGKPRKVKK